MTIFSTITFVQLGVFCEEHFFLKKNYLFFIFLICGSKEKGKVVFLLLRFKYSMLCQIINLGGCKKISLQLKRMGQATKMVWKINLS